MPVSIESIARQLIASVDSDAGYTLAAQWIIKRYEQLAVKAKLRHLRQVGQIATPASITAGTITLARGARHVVADATAKAAWTTSLVGWHLRGRVGWYEITGHNLAAGTLELLGTYEEDALADGTYTLVQQWIPLPEDVGSLGDTFINARRRWPLHKKDFEILNLEAPSRPMIAGTARVVAEAPPLPDGRRRIEFYPYSTTSESYYYIYYRSVGQLSWTDSLPSSVPAYALIEGASIDLYRYLMAKAASANNMEKAAFWRNEMNTRETKWKDYLVEAIGADRGEDDASFIMRTVGSMSGPVDIMTARDHIAAGWNWPPN